MVAALRDLPLRQREVIVLRYYADLSEAEIATAMGISRGAVKSHTARGMATLRAALEQELWWRCLSRDQLGCRSKLDYLLGIAWLASEMTDDLAQALLSRVDDAQEKSGCGGHRDRSGKNSPKTVAQDLLPRLLPLVDGDPDETWPVIRALVATITEPDQAASMARAICSAMAW